MKFTEICDALNIPWIAEGHHHCRDGWIQLDCPFCGPESEKWHCGYNLGWGNLNCWVCGKIAVLDTLIAASSGVPESEIRRMLKTLEKVDDDDRPIAFIRTKLILPDCVGPLLRAHKKYLHDRNFDVDYLKKIWEIRGIGIAPELSWRVFIPIMYRGECVSWTTRALNNNGKRYISARPAQEKISIKQILYGDDWVRGTIIINEGPTDAWAIGPGAAATCGTGYTQAQLLAMSRHPQRYVCFDNEPDAQRRARALVDDLAMFPGHTANIQLDAHDAGSAKPREIRQLRKLLK